MMAKKGFTLWFTGMSGAGKSTLAERCRDELLERGLGVEILDGDIIRTNLSKGLGFSKEDRDINIRRVGFVCDLLTRNGVAAIAACISPYTAIRDENREMIGRFVEVYCQAPLEKLIERDPKGLYKKALAGEIKGFTGIDDPYEAPKKPEVVVNTAEETIDESVAKIMRTLELMNYIPATETEQEYSEEEEEEIKKRLSDLGYI
ncbi:MAG: adenylyl-sulfate kinase [Candidatus Eisenbacteria bacterium]|nr:adenylyl-sulfate kinase [Candidatus Eisenbacteria bacterium]